MRTVLLLVLLLVLPASTRASVTDSSTVPSIRIVVGSDTVDARCVRSAPFDAVEITTVDQDVRYEPSNHVAEIWDRDGNDRTSFVLDRRKTLGEPLPKAVPKKTRIPRKPHYGPRSVTRAFVIGETTVQAQLEPGGLERSDLGGYVGFDLAIIENFFDRTAIGYGVFFGSAPEYGNAGVRLRVRRWLSDRSSLELAPGAILAEYRPRGEALPPGFSLQANYSISRWITLSTEAYSLRRRSYGYFEGVGYRPQEIRDFGVLIGVKAGHWPGAVGGIIAGFAALANMASYSGGLTGPQ